MSVGHPPREAEELAAFTVWVTDVDEQERMHFFCPYSRKAAVDSPKTSRHSPTPVTRTGPLCLRDQECGHSAACPQGAPSQLGTPCFRSSR